MPIRINLKELFPADSQEITVDKVNFNFNKLLELGIGEQGIQGFSGIQGAAGPIGIEGDQGVRGSTWIVDSAPDPNTLVIPDLLAGDLYLNSNTFEVWQYDGTQWNLLFDLTQIINAYLSQSPSPFVRGFGYGSPDDDRFIVFTRRGQTLGDIGADTTMGGVFANNANNDTLLLTNFNEDVLVNLGIWTGSSYLPTNTDDYFNSLLSIYTDHHVGGGIEIAGRNHLELGSLYDPSGSGDFKLSTIHQNLKVRTFRTQDPLYPGLDYYDTAQFSLDAAGLNPLISRGPGLDSASNAMFEFATPSYFNGGVPPIESRRTSVYIGSKRSLNYLGGVIGDIKADGTFYTDDSGASFGGGLVGLARKYYLTPFPENTGYLSVPNIFATPPSYLMIDAVGELQSVLVDSELIQTTGSIIQLGLGSPKVKRTEFSNYSNHNNYRGHAGIAVKGNTLYTVCGDPNVSVLVGAGNAAWGYFNKYRIENPNQPINEFAAAYGIPAVDYNRFDGLVSTSGVLGNCVNSYVGDSMPVGTGLADIVIAGDYAYAVNSQLYQYTANTTVGANVYSRTYFQILELDSPQMNSFGLRRVSRLGFNALGNSANTIGGTDPGEIIGAYRVAIRGKHAIVAKNALHDVSASWTALGGTGYSGGLAAIDISDPLAPEIVDSADSYLGGPNYFPLVNSARAAILDMEVVGNTAFTLTWQQTTAVSQNAQLIVEAYDLNGLNNPIPTMSWLGTSSSLTSFSGGAYANLTKRGAICGNEKYIFAGYRDVVKVINVGAPIKTSSLIAPDPAPVCRNAYLTAQTFILNFPVGYTSPEILDMKQVSNSLWILANAVSGGITDSFVFKFDVSYYSTSTNRLNTIQSGPSTLATQLHRLKLPVDIANPFYYSRFEIVGKSIYVVTNDSANASLTAKRSLIALDIDGIYTGSASIELLRAEKSDVTQDLTVGGDTVLHSSLNVGTNALIGGNLAASGLISGMGAMPVGAVMPWAGDTSLILGAELIDNGFSGAGCPGKLTNAWFGGVLGAQLQENCLTFFGWSANNGVLIHSSATQSFVVSQPLPSLVLGSIYQIEFTLTDFQGTTNSLNSTFYSSTQFTGGISVQLGNSANIGVSQIYDKPGNYTIFLQHTDSANPLIQIRPFNFYGLIQNVSVKPVLSGVELSPELLTNPGFTGSATGWTTGNGNTIPADFWQYSSNAVQHVPDPNGTAIVPIVQTGVGINNYGTYQVTVDATVNAGSYKIVLGSSINLIIDPTLENNANWDLDPQWAFSGPRLIRIATVAGPDAAVYRDPITSDPLTDIEIGVPYVLEYDVTFNVGNANADLTATVTPFFGSNSAVLTNKGITREPPLLARSRTSNTVGTGPKTFSVIDESLLISAVKFSGTVVRVHSNANPADYMIGTITRYSAGNEFEVNVTNSSGSGTFADWRITAQDFTVRCKEIIKRGSPVGGSCLMFYATGNTNSALIIDNVKLYKLENSAYHQADDWQAGLSSFEFTQSGTFTSYFNPQTVDHKLADIIQIACTSNFDGTINSVSLKEIRHTATTPKGWLLCNGASYAPAQYPALYRTIGILYGSSGPLFKVPNLASRIPVGFNVNSIPSAPLGSIGGLNRHKLEISELPPHDHVLDEDVDSASFGDSGNHTHTVTIPGTGDSVGANDEELDYDGLTGTPNVYTTSPSGNHIHNGRTGNGYSSGMIGESHNNMQPYIVMNYIIFAGN